MTTVKTIMVSVILFLVVLLMGYGIGIMDEKDYAQSHIPEMMFEQCVLPKSGGVCKNYCLINNKDLYEINVEYKKVEETK